MSRRWCCTATTIRSCRSLTPRERAITLLKHGTLKVYPGYPHGAFTIHHDVINPDILEFIRS